MPPATTTLPPLAERMRPTTLDGFVGQDHLLGEGKILRRLLEERYLPSLLFWGPPGTGKTTLAHILAQATDAHFVFFSAVLSGVKEVRDIVSQAEARKTAGDQRGTVLFVDEIHRFNKSQQDAFLPHVESGLLTLIGATTENPSFHVIAPLLSRCRVLVLQPLAPEALKTILAQAAADRENGLGGIGLTVAPEALDHLVKVADGDARAALNSLEIAASLAKAAADGTRPVSVETVEEAIQRRTLRYDNAGEEHYNLISALHKSLRDSDPDGALYWLCRMLASGEEPLYIARRLVRFASEDVGNADPQALGLAMHGRDAYHAMGSPEGELALAQVTVYLATAPKSNAVYAAYNKVMQTIRETGSLPVPLHIRNAPTRLMKELGYGKGYLYAHDHPDGVVFQEHLPEGLEGTRFYEPTNRGHEAVIRERLAKWRELLKKGGTRS